MSTLKRIDLTVGLPSSNDCVFIYTSSVHVYNLWPVKYTLLVATWIIASLLHPSARTACARTQVTLGPATPTPAPVDRPMDTG